MAKAIKTEVSIYWPDGVTVEVRNFKSIRSAKRYIKSNGIKEYKFYENRKRNQETLA